MRNSRFSKFAESGMTLVEVSIGVAMFTVAILGLGYGISAITEHGSLLRDQVSVTSACQQVLQETAARSFNELDAYNPPAAPSETTIGTFTVAGVNGTGEVRLQTVKSSGQSKLLRIRVLVYDNAGVICEMETSLAKKID